MNYWLFKSEPESWSWRQQKAKGAAGQEWDGVRNYQARNFMRAMKVGDRGFFYHSNKERAVVGVVEVAAAAHPDSTDPTGTWDCVDIVAVAEMPNPVTLDMVKAEPELAGMVLAKNSRLSVQPVAEAEWRKVCRMGGLEKA
ncbi:EVE domain-containing protein [Propylenella binzhouense]|uniref:EVE domain-containing protein n=1 Tax=Propylenella binzhouense TaxID=2555902 RepID=A0A964WVV3_9HYPH|nr:EVE domain-containing protein [Propylenella binzhouense]MYZ50433.1 EVE domain-containing protein [Propylenella binzhouense]